MRLTARAQIGISFAATSRRSGTVALTKMDETSMDLRELTAADRDAAIGLWEAAGLTRPWNDPTGDFDRALSGTTSAVLGVLDAGE